MAAGGSGFGALTAGEALVTLASSQFRAWLEGLADAGALVPAREVLARLGTTDAPARPATTVVADLTAEEVGEVLGRSPSTVRAYCRDGLLPGSYRQCGVEWRIPVEAVEAFRAAQAEPAQPAPPTRTARVRRGPVDLSAWRDEMGADAPGRKAS